MAAAEPRLTRDLPEISGLEALLAAHVAGGPPLAPMAEKLLLDTLGLGNLEVYGFLHTERPTLAGLRDWIMAIAGPPDPMLLDRYEARIAARAPGEAAQSHLAQIEAMPPALDADQLRQWDKQGYVVLPDAIAPGALVALRDLVWRTARATPGDPASWYARETDGIMLSLYRHPAIAAARGSARIHKAFAQVWGSVDLWPAIDRLGFNPPESETHCFAGSDMHFDVSLTRPIPFGTQGLLYLTDTAADQGAFRCVPGFHHRIDAWLDGLGDADPRHADFSAEEQRIAARAGDLLIWRQDLPHAASPNRGQTPRLVQYLNYYSPDMPIADVWR